MAKSKDEDIRIYELPEATSLPAGMYVAVDNETLGTKKYNISEALDSMATSADVEEIRYELESKADTEDVEEISGALESKVDTSALTSYYTKTEADNAFVSKTGYVATDNNFTTPEKEQLAGLTPIRRLGESASAIGRYNVLKVHVTQAGYFYVDLDAQTPGGYPTPATIKLCVFTPVSPLVSGARSACKFSALILGNRTEYGNILPYPVLYVKQNTSTDYIIYVILKVKNDSSVTDYSITSVPSLRWTVWRDEQYTGVGQHLDYQFMLGVSSDPDYTGSTMMEWDQVNFVDAAKITNVTPDWNAAAGTAAEILNKPTIPTASTLAGDGLEEASGKLQVVNKVPDPGNDLHRGQVLTVSNADKVVWDVVPKELPPSSAQLSGRVLTVDQTGNPEWAVVPTELPSSTSADHGKILTVDSNGGPGWDYPQEELPLYDDPTLVGTYLSVYSASNNSYDLRWEEVSAGRGLSARQDTYQGHSTKVIEVDSDYKLLTTEEYNNLMAVSGLVSTYSAYWVLSGTPGPEPQPTYTYLLLNNFISPMPATTTSDDFCNEVPSSYYGPEYQTDELVSTNPGDPMIDTDTPVDFSSKGIPTGTPCGIVDWNCCPGEDMPRYALTSGDLANGATIELWYKSDYNQQTDDSYPWLACLKATNNYSSEFIFSMETENGSEQPGHEAHIRLNVDDGSQNGSTYYYSQIMSEVWNDGNWHHYAITYDHSQNKMYVFFDGTKVITIDDRPSDIQALFTNAIGVDFAQSNGTSIPQGRFAQIAVCAECKWTNDFTVPTVAY